MNRRKRPRRIKSLTSQVRIKPRALDLCEMPIPIQQFLCPGTEWKTYRKSGEKEECSGKAGSCSSSSRSIYKKGGVTVRKELERMGQDERCSVFHWVKRSSASGQWSSVEFLLIVLEAVLTAWFLQTCCGETWAILSACCEQLVYIFSLVSLDCFYC